MLFLRDMACSVCGRVLRDVMLRPDELVAMLDCAECGTQEHVAVCNGGLGVRYRCQDFPDDPRFYRGQVETTPAAGECDGTPVPAKPVDHDARAARKDRRYWETDRKRGRTPLFFDQRR